MYANYLYYLNISRIRNKNFFFKKKKKIIINNLIIKEEIKENRN